MMDKQPVAGSRREMERERERESERERERETHTHTQRERGRERERRERERRERNEVMKSEEPVDSGNRGLRKRQPRFGPLSLLSNSHTIVGVEAQDLWGCAL